MAESQRGQAKRVLILGEQLKLAEIVKATYTDSGKNDADFALDINTTKLRDDFKDDITKSNVRSVREALGIPNNVPRYTKITDEGCTFLAGRVAALEDQMNRLTNFMKSKGFDK